MKNIHQETMQPFGIRKDYPPVHMRNLICEISYSVRHIFFHRRQEQTN